MKLMVVGGGGREHAIIQKLKEFGYELVCAKSRYDDDDRVKIVIDWSKGGEI